MSAAPARRRRPAATCTGAWLELVDTDGPFLAIPRSSASGRRACRSPARARSRRCATPTAFENAWEHWTPTATTSRPGRYRVARDEWVETVLRDVLGWAELLPAGDGPASRPSPPTTRSPSAATGALARGDADRVRWCWSSTRSTRCATPRRPLGRDAGRPDGGAAARQHVPIGIVTDGRWWAIGLRPARRRMAASGIVDALTWIEEPRTRDAFLELLGRQHIIGGDPDDRLTELFGDRSPPPRRSPRRSAPRCAAPSNCSSSRSPRRRRRRPARGEPDPLPGDRDEIYEAAVTVMMRMVFLLFAEERGLLPRAGCSSGLRHPRRARRPRRPGKRGGQRGARRHAPDLAPAARHQPGALSRRLVREHADARLRRLAVRPGPVPVPDRPHRARHAGDHGPRPGHAARAPLGPGRPAPRRGPADLLPRHRRRADRLHLRRPARLHRAPRSSEVTSA